MYTMYTYMHTSMYTVLLVDHLSEWHMRGRHPSFGCETAA